MDTGAYGLRLWSSHSSIPLRVTPSGLSTRDGGHRSPNIGLDILHYFFIFASGFCEPFHLSIQFLLSSSIAWLYVCTILRKMPFPLARESPCAFSFDPRRSAGAWRVGKRVDRLLIPSKLHGPDFSSQHQYLLQSQHLRRGFFPGSSIVDSRCPRAVTFHHTRTRCAGTTGAVQPSPSCYTARHRLPLLPHFSGKEQFRRYSAHRNVHDLPFANSCHEPDVGAGTRELSRQQVY